MRMFKQSNTLLTKMVNVALKGVNESAQQEEQRLRSQHNLQQVVHKSAQGQQRV